MVYAYTPTGSWLFKKPPQFVVETTPGVPPASPAFQIIGNVTDLNPQPIVGKTQDQGLGSRDLISQSGALTEKYTAALRWKPQTQLNFAKYGINLANEASPVGNNAESVTIAWSTLVNGIEKYFALVGVKTDKISLEVTKDGGVTVGQDIKALDMVYEESNLTSIGITTPTYVNSVPNTSTMTSRSGGLNPMTVEGVAREVRRFKIDVNQNVAELDLNGPAEVQYLQASHRNIVIDFETPYRNKQFYDAFINQTQLDMEYIIYNAVSPPIKIAITDGQIDNRVQGEQGSSNAFNFETVTMTPISCVLSGG